MVNVAPPEVENADGVGCAHCGRLKSRKWLYGAKEPRLWFCAGNKAKYGCRQKARAANAIMWEPNPAHAAGTAIVQSGSAHAAPASAAALPGRASRAEGMVMPLAVQAQLLRAWQANDALRMSEALERAHNAGLSLTGALGLAMVGNLRSPEETRQAKFSSLLSPELREILAEDAYPCLALHARDETYRWVPNCEFVRLFGLGDREGASRAQVVHVFQSFLHPEDLLEGLQTYEQAFVQLSSPHAPQVLRVSTPAVRVLTAGAAWYDGCAEIMYIQRPVARPGPGSDASDNLNLSPSIEHLCAAKFEPLPREVTLHRWRPSELMKVSHALLVDDPPAGQQASSQPSRPRLAGKLTKRRRNDDRAATAAAASCSSCAGASAMPFAPASVGSEASTASVATALRDEVAEEMTWSMQELVDIVNS